MLPPHGVWVTEATTPDVYCINGVVRRPNCFINYLDCVNQPMSKTRYYWLNLVKARRHKMCNIVLTPATMFASSSILDVMVGLGYRLQLSPLLSR